MNTQVYTEATFQRLDEARARQYAGRCRSAFAKLGQPAPTWAAGPPPLPRRPSAPKPRASAPASTLAERELTASAADGLAVPPELAAWRRATGGVVCINVRGVTLVRWTDGQKVEDKFASTAEAVEAVRRCS